MNKSGAIKQRWSGTGCGQAGWVLCDATEDAARVYDRVRNCHEALSPQCRNLARFGLRAPAQQASGHGEPEHERSLDLQH